MRIYFHQTMDTLAKQARDARRRDGNLNAYDRAELSAEEIAEIEARTKVTVDNGENIQVVEKSPHGIVSVHS